MNLWITGLCAVVTGSEITYSPSPEHRAGNLVSLADPDVPPRSDRSCCGCGLGDRSGTRRRESNASALLWQRPSGFGDDCFAGVAPRPCMHRSVMHGSSIARPHPATRPRRVADAVGQDRRGHPTGIRSDQEAIGRNPARDMDRVGSAVRKFGGVTVAGSRTPWSRPCDPCSHAA